MQVKILCFAGVYKGAQKNDFYPSLGNIGKYFYQKPLHVDKRYMIFLWKKNLTIEEE